MSGLDDLVAAAMSRKLIPDRDEPPAAPTGATHVLAAEGGEQVADVIVPEPKLNSKGGITPDVSLVFLVNGVRCILTVHVQAGATVEVATEPPTTKPKTPRGGVKVKGIRGATTEESEAPEASETLFDQSQPIGGDNLPEGWVMDPVVGATLPDVANIDNAPKERDTFWLCPIHEKAEDRQSKVTGRFYTVCPECGKLAPKT